MITAPLCRCAASPPRAIYYEREPPLPLRGISPKGEKNSGIYLNYNKIAGFFPPWGEIKRGVKGQRELKLFISPS
jgi:hypothetical protein